MKKLLKSLYKLDEEKTLNSNLEAQDYLLLNKIHTLTYSDKFDLIDEEIKKDIFYILNKLYHNDNIIFNKIEYESKDNKWFISQEKYQNTLWRTIHWTNTKEMDLLFDIRKNYHYLYTYLIYRSNLSFDEKNIYITLNWKEYTLKKENDNWCLSDYMNEHNLETHILPEWLGFHKLVTYTEVIAKLFNKKTCYAEA